MALLGAAKRRRRIQVGRFSANLALATLASADLLGGDLFSGQTFDDRNFLVSMDGTWSIRTLTAGEGPIHVGVAHSDYTDAEIEEWFESSGNIGQHLKSEQERAARKCRFVGTFAGLSTEEVLNDGKPIRTTLKFMAEEGMALKFWALNNSGAVLTTGAILLSAGQVYYKRA